MAKNLDINQLFGDNFLQNTFGKVVTATQISNDVNSKYHFYQSFLQKKN